VIESSRKKIHHYHSSNISKINRKVRMTILSGEDGTVAETASWSGA